MYTKWRLGTSSQGSSAPMSYYLCVPYDASRPCLLVPCWAEGDRFHAVQDAETALAWDERHGLRPEIARAARGLLNSRHAVSRRDKAAARPTEGDVR